MTIAPDPTPTSADFLRHLFDGAGGYIHAFMINRSSGGQHVLWAPAEHPEKLTIAVEPHRGTSDIWFSVAPRARELPAGRRGGSADCLGIVALWLDIDILGPNHVSEDLPPDRAAALALLGDFPIPPSVLVDTGGGYQAYWLLHELLPLDDAKELLIRWGATWAEKGRARGWHVDNVFDVARILRLPATWNRKSEPTPVEVVRADWSTRFNPDDLDQWCIDPPPPATTVARRHDIPYIGAERAGDAYNAVTDAAVVLEAAGFVLDSADRGNGDRHYRAPHRHDQRGMKGATVYADGHTTIWSETFAREHGMQVKRPYDPFGLYAFIEHRGDWTAARAELETRGYGTHRIALTHRIPLGGHTTAAGPGVTEGVDRVDVSFAHLVDWQKFWAGDHADEDWLAWPLAPRGRAIALYAPAKAGKSSVVLAMAAALATGRPIFGRWPCEPTSVLYLDYEMTEADLQERLVDLGYSADDDMSNLHYALLPSLAPMDAQPREGAHAVLGLAEHLDAQLIVIDTFGRAVTGKESEADTVRSFYQYVGLALKAAGRTVLRLDHAGKDLEKGQRGSSAKADDVDVVWQLYRCEGGVTLKRTHSRISWVPDIVNLLRRETDSGVTWSVAEQIYPAGTKELAEEMDRLGVPLDASSGEATKALAAAGMRKRRTLILAAQRWRLAALPTFPTKVKGTFENDGNRPGNRPFSGTPEQVREPEAKPLQEPGGNRPEPQKSPTGNRVPLLNREPGPQDRPDDGMELL